MSEEFVSKRPLNDLFGQPLAIPAGPVASDLRKSIEAAVKDIIPAGKRAAVLTVFDPFTRAGSVYVAAKIGDDWKIGGEINKAWGGPVRGQVFLSWSF